MAYFKVYDSSDDDDMETKSLMSAASTRYVDSDNEGYAPTELPTPTQSPCDLEISETLMDWVPNKKLKTCLKDPPKTPPPPPIKFKDFQVRGSVGEFLPEVIGVPDVPKGHLLWTEIIVHFPTFGVCSSKCNVFNAFLVN